jgi:hypothetical protein
MSNPKKCGNRDGHGLASLHGCMVQVVAAMASG